MIRKSRTCVLNMPMNEGQGDPHDSSGYGSNGTNHGADWASGGYGRALHFNGTGDYINCRSVGNGDYDQLTIEAWIRKTSDSPSGWRTPLHRNDGSSIGSSVFYIGLETGTSQICSVIGAGNGLGWSPGKTGINAANGAWYHVLNAWDGINERIYVNSILKKTFAFSAANFNNKAEAVTRIAASGNAGGYLFHGDICRVQIQTRNVEQGEVTANFNATKGRFGL